MKIHARQLEDREEITLDIEGEAIGPTDKAIKKLEQIFGHSGKEFRFLSINLRKLEGD